MISISDRSRMPRPARPVGSGVPLERYYPVGARRTAPRNRHRPATAALFPAARAVPELGLGLGVAEARPLVAQSSRRFLPAF